MLEQDGAERMAGAMFGDLLEPRSNEFDQNDEHRKSEDSEKNQEHNTQ